jgi:hypothetical protein
MPGDPDRLAGLEEASAEHRGVRVWSITAGTQQDLTDRTALILGEHMSDQDELHITHTVVQNGSQNRQRTRILRENEIWTELFFEYAAMIVLRGPTDQDSE